ncbi:putative prophage MuSo1%2C F protein [Campylobacter hyointestinalis subsp. hyointestinalis]|uniref:Prophage MuSo1, F protein n=2 Tax=Campylobacter hyointestinalis TaxID=198 RepID=A0A9W5EXJ9_CAMHY|nr:putative prophage MuSo1%2C F protein [Campylobacter hyointestinalis subsp. hyointestinalis]
MRRWWAMKSSISFWQEPSAALEHLKNKKSELHFDYDEIMHDAHIRTFTVAKITRIDLLNDVKSSLEDAFKNGVKFNEWKDSLKPTLQKKGWFGNTIVQNPKTAEQKEIYVGSKRLKTIYNTNMRTAYAKARYESGMQSLGEYFRYTAVLDQRTRPAHAKLHGTVLPKDDPFWDTNYPPNGWNCRCKVQVLTKAEIERKGLTPLADSSMLKNVAEKDFAYNPGKFNKIEQIYEQKIGKFSKADSATSKIFVNNVLAKTKDFNPQRDLYVWQRGLNNAVDELLVKKNLKSPINAFMIGRLNKDIASKAKSLGIDIQEEGITCDKHCILHIREDRKGGYGQDLRIEEIKKVVSVLNDKNTPVSVDMKNKNIIFWFEDEKDSSKINKVVVDLNYKLKKFGLTNYMITAGKVDRINKDKEKYIKIR